MLKELTDDNIKRSKEPVIWRNVLLIHVFNYGMASHKTYFSEGKREQLLIQKTILIALSMSSVA
ncbi:hypothetical protein CI610_01189 [invertebrate metagenome]|uniref:Uncharacterized protein n=1 Tax=invertebrate metagenome TaxID=1711999 RepID=A0A2H9T9E8_9ZZZZ